MFQDLLENTKELNKQGLKELINHINFVTDSKINLKDKKLIKIINICFCAGFDEGVRECIRMLKK